MQRAVKRFFERLRFASSSRIDERFPCSIPVVIHPASGGEPFSAFVTDWSPGGLFVSTPERPDEESLVTAEIRSGESAFRLRAQVLRCQSGPPEGLALMFTDFTQGEIDTLRRLLTKAAK